MGDKFAVLIAVERYADPRWDEVRFAEADARDLSAALLELGVPIDSQSLLINQDATKARIDSRLRRAVDALLEDDELFIYYAGHGFAEVNQNYLTCHDSEVLDMVRTSVSCRQSSTLCVPRSLTELSYSSIHATAARSFVKKTAG